VVKEDIAEFERMAQQHDSRQPFIESELIAAIKMYNAFPTGLLLRTLTTGVSTRVLRHGYNRTKLITCMLKTLSRALLRKT
jgi:hypothetical protein